jgi:hypothetical protein
MHCLEVDMYFELARRVFGSNPFFSCDANALQHPNQDRCEPLEGCYGEVNF